MRRRIFIVPIFIFSCCLNSAISFAEENEVDPREAAIDRAIGGMIEGGRPLPPQNYAGKNQIHKVPGANLSPGMDAKVNASANGFGSVVQGATGTSANSGESTNAGTETGGASEPATEPATEPASEESTGDSIVNVDANVDLSGGEPAVDANLTVDTNADSLLSADTSATTDVASVDTTVTENGIIAGQDLTTTVNEAPIDAVLDAEVVATDIPSESEATAGLEADVDPVTADSDVAPIDPADGLGL